MRVHVKIKNVVTVNTDTKELRENQPLAEFTLELRKEENGVISKKATEIKFTEMLSNLDGMDAIQIANHMTVIIEDYVKTAIKGQAALGPDKEWVERSRLIGTKYTFDI